MSLPVEELNSLLESYRYLIKLGNEGDKEALGIVKHFPYRSSLIERYLGHSPTRDISKEEVDTLMPTLKRQFPDLYPLLK